MFVNLHFRQKSCKEKAQDYISRMFSLFNGLMYACIEAICFQILGWAKQVKRLTHSSSIPHWMIFLPNWPYPFRDLNTIMLSLASLRVGAWIVWYSCYRSSTGDGPIQTQVGEISNFPLLHLFISIFLLTLCTSSGIFFNSKLLFTT